MSQLFPYLTLNHVNSSGADQQTASFCGMTLGVPYASPSGDWLPALDEGSIQLPEERVMQGRSPVVAQQQSPVSVKLAYEHGGTIPLDVLDGRIYLGQEATIAYAGTDGAGNVHTTADPLVAVKGTVVGRTDHKTASATNLGTEIYGAHLELFILPHNDILATPIPDRPLLGYPGGLLGKVDGSVCTTGYTTLHSQYTFRAYILVPLVWPTGASDRIHILGNRECSLRAKLHTDGFSWRLLAAFTTNAGGAVEEIDGPLVTPAESFRHLALAFDTSPGGGGVAAFFYVDGALESSPTSATTFHSLAGDVQMMRYESTTTTVCTTIAGAFMVFSALTTAATEARLAKSRATTTETDMVLFYPGRALVTATAVNPNAAAAVDNGGGLVGIPSTAHGLSAGDYVQIDQTTNYDGFYELDASTSVDELVIAATFVAETFAGTETVTQQSGTLLDLTENNGSSPFDATFTNCRPASLFEGDEGMAGLLLPRVWQMQHIPPTWVDAPNKIARVSDVPCEGITWAGDLGDVITLEQHGSILGFVESAPAAGAAAVTGFGGGLIKLGANLTDNGRLAADVLGTSADAYSLSLGANHGGSTCTFPSGFLPGGSDFAIDFKFSYAGVNATTGAIFISSFLEVVKLTDTVGDDVVQFKVFYKAGVVDPAGFISLTASVPELGTTFARIQGREVGGEVEAKLVVNGALVGSETTGGGFELAEASLTTTRIGDSTDFDYVGSLPLRWWGPTGVQTTDAALESHVRKFLFRNPVDGTDAEWSQLSGFWHRPDPSSPLNTVKDEIGSNDGTVTNPGASGRFAPGLCWADPLFAYMLLLRDYAGIAETDITITEQAYDGVEHSPLCLWAGSAGEETLGAVLAQLPGYVLLSSDETATIGAFVAPTQANSSGTLAEGDTCTTIEPGEDVLRPEANAGALPPSVAMAEWGRIGIRQDPDSTVAADRAALMVRDVASETIPVGTNETKYNDKPYPNGRVIKLIGCYRDRDAALAALDKLVAQWEDPRDVRTVAVTPGQQAPRPGEVWGFRDPRGGVFYRVAMARKPGAFGDVYTTR